MEDARRFREVGEIVGRVGSSAEPSGVVVAGRSPSGSVVMLCGSFNPPTMAHVGLAHAAIEALDGFAYLVLSTFTVNKERVEGACLEDRLLMLDALVAEHPRLGSMLINRGLYVDQAALVRSVWPHIDDVVFAVGFDKIVQIFDPRYYDDRETALTQLFDLARFLVAPRAAGGPDEIRELVGRPDNARFADRVTVLEVDDGLREISSSAARAGALNASELPSAARFFVARSGAYDSSSGRYERRLRRLRSGWTSI
jgi:nicotinic acid mononucleotide adenylyltransferase